jgi:hypothetical protein
MASAAGAQKHAAKFAEVQQRGKSFHISCFCSNGIA